MYIYLLVFSQFPNETFISAIYLKTGIPLFSPLTLLENKLTFIKKEVSLKKNINLTLQIILQHKLVFSIMDNYSSFTHKSTQVYTPVSLQLL